MLTEAEFSEGGSFRSSGVYPVFRLCTRPE